MARENLEAEVRVNVLAFWALSYVEEVDYVIRQRTEAYCCTALRRLKI